MLVANIAQTKINFNLMSQFLFLSGRFLITYVRAWQNILIESRMAKFEFNTYMISVLVIFFLQVTYNLPKVNEISLNVSNADISNFKIIPHEFFEFYGNYYQLQNHVISASIGQWEVIQTQSESGRSNHIFDERSVF